MIIRNFLTRALARWLKPHVEVYMIKHPPTQIIGGVKNPYLFRWCVFRKNRIGNVYLHMVVRNDDDRALHDHPFDSISIVLDGPISEIRKTRSGEVVRNFEVGDVVFRGAAATHRLFLSDFPAMTCFFVGPRRRQWGFHCPKGWVPWQKFTAFSTDANGDRVGGGCE